MAAKRYTVYAKAWTFVLFRPFTDEQMKRVEAVHKQGARFNLVIGHEHTKDGRYHQQGFIEFYDSRATNAFVAALIAGNENDKFWRRPAKGTWDQGYKYSIKQGYYHIWYHVNSQWEVYDNRKGCDVSPQSFNLEKKTE